jgi:nitric oxide reductase subunit B
VGHAHAATFGAFGFLAVGMATYAPRITTREWNSRRLRWAFWLWNAGLAVMVFGSVLPVGFLQLEVAFTAGYDAARSLASYERPLVQALFWARLPGDAMIILGTPLFGYDIARKLTRQRAPTDAAGSDSAVAARVTSSEDD